MDKNCFGHWCDFCDAYHTSVSCYHPGRHKVAALERQVAELREALQECMVDLEAEVNSRYGYPDVHHGLLPKYERDISPVIQAKEVLEQTAKKVGDRKE